MGHSIESIAWSIAFGPTSISRQFIVKYIIEMERMIQNETKYGRSPRKYQKFLKARLLSIDFLNGNKTHK